MLLGRTTDVPRNPVRSTEEEEVGRSWGDHQDEQASTRSHQSDKSTFMSSPKGFVKISGWITDLAVKNRFLR
jgi:hypothetical protein